MAYEIPGQMVTLEASTTLTQYTFVTVDANGKAARPADGGTIFGVLQNKPTAGQAASVMINGLSKVLCGASTLSAGDLVSTTTGGRAVAVAATEYAVGRIVFGSSGSTDRVITVAIEPIGTT